jgi:hypothetical protein
MVLAFISVLRPASFPQIILSLSVCASAGIFKQFLGARNRGIGLSYWPAESSPGLLRSLVGL